MKWLSCVLALAVWGCASAEPNQAGLRADASGGGGGQMDAPSGMGSGSGSGSGSGMGSGSGSGMGSGSGGGSGCSGMKDLLANGSFDATPAGTGWTSMPINAADPIVTTDPGVLAPQSGTMLAFLGGYAQAATDTIYQDVMVPANATALTLTGFYSIKTNELFPGTYDTSKVEIVSTANATIELVRQYYDKDRNTAWTALDKPMANFAAMKGQTIRLKISSTSDSTYATGFVYDTLKLVATCP